MNRVMAYSMAGVIVTASICISPTGRMRIALNESYSQLELRHASSQLRAVFSKEPFHAPIIDLHGCLGGVCRPDGSAADNEVALTIKNHQFSPAEIKVPANQRIKLNVITDCP